MGRACHCCPAPRVRSFEGIAAANNTSLAVVAPGIAEALFATAMRLAAAIPAVVAYNKVTVDLGRFVGRMQGLIGRCVGPPLWPHLDHARRAAIMLPPFLRHNGYNDRLTILR
jgi:MotA/TolQ/ExbB proton channel family